VSVSDFYKWRHAYHFTSLWNLESVIDNGLLSTNRKIAGGVGHLDVANQEIQRRRKTMAIPGVQDRYVHDYVPFYFAKRTPMQIAVLNKKNVDQELLVYFAISLKIIDDRPGAFFTNASANTEILPEFYAASQSDKLSCLNWAIIDRWKWTYSDDDERHQKMAELLVPDHVSSNEISYIVTWDESIAEYVKKCFFEKGVACPDIVHDEMHYFTNRGDGSSIITGPYFLKENFEEAVNFIVSNQNFQTKFPNLESALYAIRASFDSIRELADVDGLGAGYGPHRDDVGTHSRRVAGLVLSTPEYRELNSQDQMILELAAYLHDIGKGPKSRWVGSYMDKADNNHANKSLPMLKRILTQDIGSLSRDSIRKLVMLVTYDDLLGDIAAKGRDPKQFFEIITCESDVNMLVALSKSDIGSISQMWLNDSSQRIGQLQVDGLNFLRGAR
jgi:hypothetical protein